MYQDYHPELDATPGFDAKHARYSQKLIGVLRWMCKLGHINILIDVLMLSWHLVSPKEKHLEEVFYIFSYLKLFNHLAMVFDDIEPTFDESCFTK